MSGILQDLSPEKIIGAIEENLAASIDLFSTVGEVKVNDPPGVKRVISDIPIPLFNSIMDSRLATDKVEMAIRRVVEDARLHHVPILWWIGPSSRPIDLETQLEKHGFILADDSPGMAVELGRLNENLPTPEGLDIRAARDGSSWWQWCNTMTEGFEIPPQLEFFGKAWHNLLSMMDPQTSIPYVAYLNGKPVATSLLLLGGGVAGIYAVATVPAARRMGIGAQVTLYPLIQARLKGYQAGVLEASQMGESVYHSIGFRGYCRIRSYRFRP